MNLVVLFGCSAVLQPAPQAPVPTDTRMYEIRTYFATPGKLDALHARFRDHTIRLFKRHGIESIGYWVPVENPDRKLIYIIACPSREARDKSFATFMADPDWVRARTESEADGPLVEKVVSVFLKPTDYTPKIKPTSAKPPRLFELRTYIAAKDKLPALNARFRDHTVRLFRKHGIQSIGYWVPVEVKTDADYRLVYLVAHANAAAAARSWAAFRVDPQWLAAREASERDGSLLEKAPISEMLVPTPYSPTQ